MAKIDNKWIKNLADVGGAGNEDKLITSDKIYDATVGKQLSQAILDGDIGNSGVNFISNGDAEINLDGWSTYNDGALSVPDNGAGGTANITLTRVTGTGMLNGNGSFLLTKDALNRQGEGIQTLINLPEGYKSQLIEISFNFEQSANYADDDIGIYVYDITNSKLIRFNNEELKAKSPTGIYKSWFQAPANSTSLRLIFHIKSTNANAYTLKFDDVVIKPADNTNLIQETNTEKALFKTITGHGSTNTKIPYFTTQVSNASGLFVSVENSSTNGFSITALKKCRINMRFLGVLSAATDQAGISKNSTELTSNIYNINVEHRVAYDIPASASQMFDVSYSGILEEGDVLRPHTSGSFSDAGRWSISFEAMSVNNFSEASGRSVHAHINGSSTIVANSSPTKFVLNNTVNDTNNIYQGGGDFLIPESGIYSLESSWWSTSLSQSASFFEIRVNNVTKVVGKVSSASIDRLSSCISNTLPLNANDVVSFWISQYSFGSVSTTAGVLENYAIVTKIADLPNVVQPNETIFVFGKGDSAQTITANTTNIPFTEVEDSHDAWDGSVFTAPINGDYIIKGHCRYNIDAGNLIRLYKNNVYFLADNAGEPINGYDAFDFLVRLNKGDTIGIRSDVSTVLTGINPEHHHITIRNLK